jgi:hypothetical protein
MRDAYGTRRLKWTLEWPVTTPHSLPGRNNLPVNIPHVNTELVVLGSVLLLGLALVTFRSADSDDPVCIRKAPNTWVAGLSLRRRHF